jgi:heme oxygenase
MTTNIMEILREETRPLHNQTEGNDFQKSLFGGSLPKIQFVKYLGQMYLIHKALEDALSELRISNPIVDSIIADHQYQQNFLRTDLIAAQVKVEELTALPATQTLIKHMEQLKTNQPIALLGCEYVLFGSKHGAKLLSKQLEKYGLTAPGAPNYFDPYGDKFMGYWQDFKANMNAAQLSANEQEDAVNGAKDMFSGLSKVFDDLISLVC